MDGKRQSITSILLAVSLIALSWVENFVMADPANGKALAESGWVRYLSTFKVAATISITVFAAMLVICVNAFRKRFHVTVRGSLVMLTAAAVLLPLYAVLSPFAPKGTFFTVFWSGVTQNSNLNEVVLWSRRMLSESEGLKGPGYYALDQSKIPREVAYLYGNPDDSPPVNVGVCIGSGDNQNCIAINYFYGPERYGLFIGPTNFNVPSGSVKLIRKWEDGVFVFGDWR